MAVKKTVRAAAVLAVLLAGGGFYLWQVRQDTRPADRLVLYGNVDIRQIELAFNGSERIDALEVQEGDRINAGQLLAKLETERFELAVARAAAQAETQRQVVARMEAGTRPEEIQKARADVAAAAAALEEAQQTLKRVSALVPQQAASVQRLDDARGAADTAAARLKAARAILDLALAGPRKEDILGAKALLKRYEAELGLAKRNLKDAFLHAPTDGVIQDRILEVGDMASPQKPVFTVALLDPLWIRAYVSEPDLGKIHEGMTTDIYTDSFPGRRYEGWIGFISPAAEFTPKPVETPEVRTRLVYQVRVFVKDPRNELRLGMPATAIVEFDTSEGTGHRPASGAASSGGNG
jgi:HlyD family secretion protein